MGCSRQPACTDLALYTLHGLCGQYWPSPSPEVRAHAPLIAARLPRQAQLLCASERLRLQPGLACGWRVDGMWMVCA